MGHKPMCSYQNGSEAQMYLALGMKFSRYLFKDCEYMDIKNKKLWFEVDYGAGWEEELYIKKFNKPVFMLAPATIKIIRDSSMVAAIAPTIISLNGAVAATIVNGGSAVIRVYASPIVLQTNASGSKYVRYELDVPSGAYGEVHVKANVFQPKLTVWK